MNYLSLSTCFVFLLACSQIKTVSQQKPIEEVKVEEDVETTQEQQNYRFKTHQVIINPGHAKYVKIRVPKDLEIDSLKCTSKFKNPFYHQKDKGFLHMFFVETYFSELKAYECSLEYPRGTKHLITEVKVEDTDFPTEKLSVDRKRVELSPKNLARVQREQAELNKVYAKFIPRFLFEKAFVRPLDSILTSYYGTRRVFNNIRKSQHLGNDFRAGVGVPIPVANNGVVAYAGNLFFSGNTVIINHGLGLFSTYGHLSKIKVQTGDYLVQGNILGLAGKTGRVTAPHLHWGVKFAGHWVDGFSIIEETIKYAESNRDASHQSLRSYKQLRATKTIN